MRTGKTFLLLLWLPFCAAAAPEDDDEPVLQYELRGATILSDNIRRVAANQDDEIVTMVGGYVNWVRRTLRTSVDLKADLNFNHYIDGTYDDDVTGAIDGTFRFQFIPEKFSWVVKERFGQLVADPFESRSPGNRENINIFSTGPDLAFRFGSRLGMNISALFRDQDYETRNADNQVLGTTFELTRQLNANRILSLNASFEDIDYKDPENNDYQWTAAYVTLRSAVGKGGLLVSLGTNSIKGADEKSTRPLANVTFSRAISPRTTFRLAYSQRYSDPSQLYNQYANPDFGFGETEDYPGDDEPFEAIRFAVSSNTVYGRNLFYLELSSTDENYQTDNPFERRRLEFLAGVNRQLSQYWQIGGDVRFYSSDYRNVDRTDDDASIGIRLTRQITRTLFVDLGYSYSDRRSNVDNADFDENRIVLMVRYNPFRLAPEYLQ